MPTTKYGDIGPRTAAYAAKRLLKRGQHILLTERFGQTDPLRKRSSDTVKFRRYESLPRATAPLAEGIPPAGQRLNYTDMSATLEEYGDFVRITNKIMDTHEDPVLREMIDLCGEQAAETVEVIRIAFLKAGTNVYYANGVASRSLVTSPPLRGDFLKIVRGFKRSKCREISKIIAATPNVATEPVAAAYFCMTHSDLDADIENITGFVPAEQYSKSGKTLPGELGKSGRVRFVSSALFEPWLAAGVSGSTYLTNGASGTGQADVYPTIVVGRDGYGIVPLQGREAVVPKVKNPGGTEIGDPLGQLGHVAWHTYQTGGILNQNWVARLEAAATANPI